jgi:hypothetical protein
MTDFADVAFLDRETAADFAEREWGAALAAWEIWVGHARDVVGGRAPALPAAPALPTSGPPPISLALRAQALLESIDQIRATGAARLEGELRAGMAYADAARSAGPRHYR